MAWTAGGLAATRSTTPGPVRRILHGAPGSPTCTVLLAGLAGGAGRPEETFPSPPPQMQSAPAPRLERDPADTVRHSRTGPPARSSSRRRRRALRRPRPWSRASERLTYAELDGPVRTGSPAACAASGVGRSAGGVRAAPLRRAGGGDPRHLEGRRRLRAARPRVPRRTSASPSSSRTPVRRCCSRRGVTAAAAPPGRRAGSVWPPSGSRSPRDGAAAPDAARQPRLRDLHLRVDRPPQGGRHRAPQRRGAGALGARRSFPTPRPRGRRWPRPRSASTCRCSSSSSPSPTAGG